jgi:hypothetical protein
MKRMVGASFLSVEVGCGGSGADSTGAGTLAVEAGGSTEDWSIT